MKTLLHRIHIPPRLAGAGDTLAPVIVDRRAAVVGELLVQLDGKWVYGRYTLGLQAPDGGLQKAGIVQPDASRLIDGVSILDLQFEDDWRSDVCWRMKQALAALDRPTADRLEPVAFYHSLQPLALARGCRSGRPFLPTYVDARQAEADVDNPYHGLGCARATALRRVLADELLVHVPAARRRWTCYPLSVFDDLQGAPPVYAFQQLLVAVDRARAVCGRP